MGVGFPARMAHSSSSNHCWIPASRHGSNCQQDLLLLSHLHSERGKVVWDLRGSVLAALDYRHALIISNVCYGKNFCLLWCLGCFFLVRNEFPLTSLPQSFLFGSMSWAPVWSPPRQLVVLHTVKQSSSAKGLGVGFRQTATNPSLGN